MNGDDGREVASSEPAAPPDGGHGPDEGPGRRPAGRPDGVAGGVRVGRVGGVPVYVNASWLLLAGLIIFSYGRLAQRLFGLSTTAAYAVGVLFVVCLMASVLLHELGHALTARRFGIRVKAITLQLLGGFTEMEADTPSPRADLVISLAGPVVSGLLGLVSAALAWALPAATLPGRLAVQLAAGNIIVAVFNALPGLPLDGGRALRAVVWAVSGDRHLGSRVAGWLGRVIAVLAMVAVLALYLHQAVSALAMILTALVTLTLWQGATAAIRYGRAAARIPMIDLSRLTRPVFAVAMGTPLAEAQRRAGEAGLATAVVGVTDGSGRLVALVHEQEAEAVPGERRPWVPVEAVSRSLQPGRTLAAGLSGAEVIRAVQADPAASYLVVRGDDVLGVLRTADLARMLDV